MPGGFKGGFKGAFTQEKINGGYPTRDNDGLSKIMAVIELEEVRMLADKQTALANKYRSSSTKYRNMHSYQKRARTKERNMYAGKMYEAAVRLRQVNHVLIHHLPAVETHVGKDPVWLLNEDQQTTKRHVQEEIDSICVLLKGIL